MEASLNIIKNYVKIFGGDIFSKQLPNNLGDHQIIKTPEEFCKFFFQVYEADDCKMNCGFRTPTESSIQVYYVLLELFLANDEGRKKMNANIGKLFSKYNLDLNFDLTSDQAILDVLSYLSEHCKLGSDASIEVVFSYATKSHPLYDSVYNKISAFKSRVKFYDNEGEYFCIKEADEHDPVSNSVSLRSSASIKWNKVVDESCVTDDGIVTLTDEQAYIYVSKDWQSVMMLPQNGAVLFASAMPITQKSIDLLYKEKVNDSSKFLTCNAVLPQMDICCSVSGSSLADHLFQNLSHRLGGLIDAKSYTVHVKEKRRLSRVGASAVSEMCDAIDGSFGNYRCFDCRNHGKIYISLLNKSNMLFNIEIHLEQFEKSCKLQFIEEEGSSGKIHRSLVRSCMLCINKYGDIIENLPHEKLVQPEVFALEKPISGVDAGYCC